MYTMKIITKAIEHAFDKQGSTSNMSMDEIKIVMKLFNPMGAQTWYIYEHLKNGHSDDSYMAFVNMGDSEMAEMGLISLNEILELRLPLGLKIERDKHFTPLSKTLRQVYDTVKAGGHV
jgi:hypothetical protein